MQMLGVIKKNRILYIVSVILLTLSFTLDVFGVQSLQWFGGFQKDSDAFVVHKLACRDELGKDVFGGMLVMPRKSVQFSLDERKPICQKADAAAYVSQYGLQGKATELAYKATHALVGLSLPRFLILMQGVWAVITAGTLGLFVVWVADKFGRFSAGTVLALLSVSVWIVGFAHTLYWATPLFFWPLLFTLFFYQKLEFSRKYGAFLVGIFVLFFLRFLNGYEFTPEVILSPVAAVAFLVCQRTTSVREFIKEGAVVCAVGALAFMGAFGANYYQVYQNVGNGREAFDLIKQRALLRTTESGGYAQYVYSGLDYTVPTVYSDINNYIDLQAASEHPHMLLTNILSLVNYALLPVVNLPINFNEPAYTVISSFTFVAVLSWVALKKVSIRTRLADDWKYVALKRAMIVGLGGSLIWLVLGHSHSFVHAHIDGIIFYLPFLLFAYVALGLWLEKGYVYVRNRLRVAE